MKQEVTGLGTQPKSEWAGLNKHKLNDLSPRELLKNPETHARVKNYLLERIRFSEQEVNKLKARWKVNDKKYQAYITLADWEKQLKNLTDSGAPPRVVSIVVPYCFATINTIVTYLAHTFTGRRPIFQVTSRKAGSTDAAMNMEIKLQYDADHTRLVKQLFQFLHDGQQYGVGILRCQWLREEKLRTRTVEGVDINGNPYKGKQRERMVVFEGNEIASIDPYKFLPDPRVAMCEVNRKGEFVFWKDTAGKHYLKKLEQQGSVFDVDRIPVMESNPFGDNDLTSDRSLRTGGDELGGYRTSQQNSINNFITLHQGSIEIIPAELGLGSSEYPEKWLFTIANKSRIIQAQPLELDHDMHPVVVSEPYTTGYSFGQLGMTDYLGSIQDTMSWLVNSHMDNVRTALNNMFVIDPSRIELQDVREPGAGKLIRAKKAAYGQDISRAIQQFAVQDVTHRHMEDFQLFTRIGDSMSSITDNLRGIQSAGGRKTATEVRTAGEAGASRLASLARVISAQAIVDLTEQMSLNNQQLLTDEFFAQVVGQDGIKKHTQIAPEQLIGDFHYPINDGTLPIDRVAMVDVWKDIFMGVSQDQELRGRFNLVEMFKHIAELGGAKNIEKFEVKVEQEDVIAQQVQAGNVATPEQLNVNTSPTKGVEAKPSRRLMT